MYDIRRYIERHFQDDYLEYGQPVTDLRVNCPFCLERHGSEDVKYKLHISLHKETCHCFRCDYTSSWIRLVMNLQRVNYHRAIGELYKKPKPSDMALLARIYKGKEYEGRSQAENYLLFPKDYEALEFLDVDNVYRRYMLRRDFNDTHFQYYKIGVAPKTTPNRVYIPVEGAYYQARAIYSFMEPKYMTPDMPSDDLLFNPVALKLYDEVVITEGCLSAMAVGKNAIALLGANPTTGKVNRLIDSNVKHFIITVEYGKEKSMATLAKRLTQYGKHVTMWYYPPDEDPADGVVKQVASYDLREHVRVLLTKP